MLPRWLDIYCFKYCLLIYLILSFKQEYTVKAEESISRLNKEVKVEHDGRVTAEKKVESTEEALIILSQENAALQAKLDETQKKLEASEAELASLRKTIIDLLIAVFGKSSTCLWNF